MNALTRPLIAIALAVTLLAAPCVQAGRIGGPASDVGTLMPGQTVWFDVPLAAGVPAVISVTGDGPGNIDLYVYDGSGNVTVGVGVYERRMATLNVWRAGFFRIELRNTGNVTSTVLVSIN